MHLIVLEDFEGLVFYPPEQIATLTPFLWGWWRAVTTSGEVLHLPQRPDGPWLPMGESWVLPGALQTSPAGWRDEAGFVYAGKPPDSSSPPAPTHEPLWGMRTAGGVTFLTDQGEEPSDLSEAEALELHPELVQVGRGLFGNRNRFRRLRPVDKKFELWLDNGRMLHSMHAETARQLAEGLGLPDPNRLQPVIPGMREYRLRDYPLELYRTEAEQMRAWFREENVLIANSLLQVVRYLKSDPTIEYGHDHRGLWYNPVSTNLYRCGFIDADEVRWVEASESGIRESKEAACLRYGRVILRMVGDLRLFSYRDLGFEDPGGRSIGTSRPEILLLVEKNNLAGYARKLQAHFGLSYYVSGGATKLVDVEFLARDLLERGVSEVDLYGFVDFDPGGTALAEGLVPQLARFGIHTRSGPHLVVHPSCFSDQELRLFALPCPMTSASAITLTKLWVEKTGGVKGKPFGIGADHMVPLQRVIARMEDLGVSP